MANDFAYTKELPGASLADAETRVRAALKEEGFGVLTEIDIQAAFKEKLGLDRAPYKILGACNPKLASQALAADPAIGVLLPCNVTVFQGGGGVTTVQAVNPIAMFSVVNTPGAEAIAQDVDERIRRVMDSL